MRLHRNICGNVPKFHLTTENLGTLDTYTGTLNKILI
jgi:hypothetical protein